MDDKVYFVGPLERVLHLKTFAAMEGLESDELAAVAQYARERFFAAGSRLFQPEEPAQAFYLIVQGRVRVNRRGRPSQAIGVGEVVGFLHLLARARTGLEAVAETDTLTLEFDSDAQLDICEDHFPVLVRYIRYLSERSLDELRQAPSRLIRDGALPFEPRLGALDLVERMLVLSRARPFRGCNPDALAELSRHVTEASWNPGDAVWQNGDPADYFFVMVSGSLTCTAERDADFVRGPGAPVGMYEALCGQPRWYDARATDASAALRIDVDPFLDILEDHFDMAMDFIAVIAFRLVELLEESEATAAGPVSAPEPALPEPGAR